MVNGESNNASFFLREISFKLCETSDPDLLSEIVAATVREIN